MITKYHCNAVLCPFLLTMAILAGGCHSAASDTDTKYQTVASDPRRQTDLAKQLNAKGLELIAANQLPEAEGTLKDALSADMMYGPAHNNLGQAYFRQKKLYLAAWEFQYAGKLMPDQPEPRNNLGLVFEEVGKLDDAITAYADALKLAPDNIQAMGNLARARIKHGDRGDDVRDLLQRLVSQDTRQEWVQWARETLMGFTTQPPHPEPSKPE